MHSSLVRGQNVFGFFTTVAFCTAILTAISVLSTPQHPSASIRLRNVEVIKGRPHYYSTKRAEYAQLKFDLDADLTSLFNWNTKQVFVWLAAVYPSLNDTSVVPSSEAVIWDSIINSNSQLHPLNPLQYLKTSYSPETKSTKTKRASATKKQELYPVPGIIHLKNSRPKYQITDISDFISERNNVTLELGWNVQPWVGALTWTLREGRQFGRWNGVRGGKSKVFDMPPLKGKKPTVAPIVSLEDTPEAAAASAII